MLEVSAKNFVERQFTEQLPEPCVDCPKFGKAGFEAVRIERLMREEGVSKKEAQPKIDRITNKVFESCLRTEPITASDTRCEYGRSTD